MNIKTTGMKTLQDNQILTMIGDVYEKAEKCKLKQNFFDEIDDKLTVLSQYFNLSKIQSFLVTMIFVSNCENNSADIRTLAEHFDCSTVRVLKYDADLKELINSSILKKERSRHRRKKIMNESVEVNRDLCNAIIEGKTISSVTTYDFNDIIELFEKIGDLLKDRDDDEISTSELLAQTDALINSNGHFPFINRVQHLKLNTSDVYLYFYVIWTALSSGDDAELVDTLEKVYDNSSVRVRHTQHIISEESPLIKKDLIEIKDEQFLNRAELRLTDNSRQMLGECGVKLSKNRHKKDNIITPETILSKELIYNETEMSQLLMLKKVLQENNLKEMHQRLSRNGLPQGITVLFHGAPGTGKTESVLQMAKETGRAVMKVDISQSKSMWFGESEKKIKRIFTDYKSLVKESETTPILLFNEADALISKRTDISSSGANQTENSIQNILLEELESFEGIFMATTNLARNFDTAFERRFLFKINFQKPDINAKAKIWKLKLPRLSLQECQKLANHYDFSGGEIDNIVRKNVMHDIINGKNANFCRITEFCQEERMVNERVRVGF